MTKDQKIADLEKRLSDLGDRFDGLMVAFESQRELIAELQSENAKLRKENAELKEENAKLREQLSVQKVRKDSSNSSMNPASDLNRQKRTNLRDKTERKVGGQPGHEGGTQPMVEVPDVVEQCRPSTCAACTMSLEGIDGVLVATAQVTKIPPIVPIVHEYQKIAVVCTCGCRNTGEFPEGVVPGAQYGKCVTALVAYLSVRQYMAVERIGEFFGHVLNMPLSTGTIAAKIGKFATRCADEYEGIRQEIFQSRQVGGDETGAKVNGEKGWFWTWQTKLCTLIVFAMTRGFVVVKETFPNGLPNSILSHDCLAAQCKTLALAHQICMAHILRDLKFCIVAYKCDWALATKALIKETLGLKDAMAPEDHGADKPWVVEMDEAFDALLAMEVQPKNEMSVKVRNRLLKNRDSCLQFLYHPEVPPDNNGSERAIRNIKVKQKVSTQFRSEQGASDFAVIRSVIDTAIKRGQNVLQYLAMIA